MSLNPEGPRPIVDVHAGYGEVQDTRTTALALRGEQPPSQALGVIREDPLMAAVAALGQIEQLARAMVASGFMPRAINTPEKAMAVMLTGREMGIGPMQSIRSINIIDAKPVVAADLQLALFKRSGGRAIFQELTPERACLALRHPNGDEHTEQFTAADAQAAGLLHKDNWKKHRVAMMRSRVITAALKSIGFEATTGVYDPDEADHFGGGNAGGTEAPPARPSLPRSDASGTSSSTPSSATTATPTTGGTTSPTETFSPRKDTADGTSRYSTRFPYAPHKGIALDSTEADGGYTVDDAALDRCGEWCAKQLSGGEAKNPAKLTQLGQDIITELNRRALGPDEAQG